MMSYKKAFKAIFTSYKNDQPIRATYLERVANREDVNFHKLEKAVMDKGLDLVP